MAIKLVVGDNGVGIITINNPPLNLLNTQAILSLKDSIEEALLRDEVKAIVICGARGKFSGGFNVTAFGKSNMAKKPKEVGFLSIEVITDLLEAARKPIVAAIDGPAFGGGLEIALACHARIATPTSQLGLPELQYGIIPGFGGTQRLPRLVGLPKALEMILMSKRVNGKDAFSISLVDALARADELNETASSWALDILKGRKPWIASLYRTDRLEPLKEARLILNTARTQSRKQNPNLTHPLICIDVIEEGIVSGPRNALWKEAVTLNELRQSETCITDTGLKPRKVKKVAVIGGGLVGCEIATEFILGNFHVILKEIEEKSLVAAIGKIKANLQSCLMAGKVTNEGVSRLKGVLDYDSFIDVDLVVETLDGSIQSKQQTFVELEHYCPQHCILASNTSTVDLNLIGERTNSRSRIVGAHFCSTSILEIVHTQGTTHQVIVDLLDVAKKIKKTPILVRNSTGLVVDRLSVIYSQAAMFLAEQGEEKYHLEQVMQNFGMSVGLFRTMDSVDNVPLKVGKLSEQDIIEMILFPVVNEACRIMEEGSVVKASDIDVASVLAMGFPSYRGGIIFWANTLGLKYICSRLDSWSNKYGSFFKPCDYLIQHSSLIKSQM
ncbi:glyoxysomal fatty acid beta-oxidation multifunctional protein MFP-a [Tanacetum coccineum]